MIKRILSCLLAWLLVQSVLPVQALAAEDEIVFEELPLGPIVVVNPLYADIIPDDPIPGSENRKLYVSATRVNASYLSETAGAAVIRDGMEARMGSISVNVYSTATSDPEELVHKLMDMAMAHTGVPTEGDYILWHYAKWTPSGSYGTQNDVLYVNLTYDVEYLSTASQETQVTNRVNELIASWNLDNASDYRKIKTVYDYLCNHISYDNSSVGDVKYTAYAGLINGTCVCQGYASLFYRFVLELGIDTRVIAGESGGNHGWNIVKLGNLYYNLDATWDAGKTKYDYFLKNPSAFSDHIRWDAYNSTAFNSQYPMASDNYAVPPVDDVIMLSAVGHEDGNIVSWSGASNAAFYQLFRRVSDETTWTLVVNTTALTYQDTTAVSGVKYYYKVRGRNGTLMGSLNIPGVGCIRPAPKTLDNVTMISADGDSTGNLVKWNPVANARFYQVYRLESGQTTWTLLKNTSATEYKDEQARVGVRSYYKVVARNGDVKSGMNIASVGAVRPVTGTLQNVQMDSAQGHAGGISVRWNAVDGAAFYQVYRLESGTTTWTLLRNTDALAYEDTTAVPGVRYYYKVVARCGSLKSSMTIDSVTAVRPS